MEVPLDEIVIYKCNIMAAILRQYIASTACSLSVSMLGTCFVWLEPLMLPLTSPGSEIPMTTTDTSWLVSSIELGQIAGAIPAGILADRYGRKPIIVSAGPMALLSWLLVLTTRNIPVLYIVRLIQGVVAAFSLTVVPMYVAEISAANIRGQLSGHFQTFWYFGILYCYATGPFLSYQNYIIACAAIPIVFTVIFYFMPESPFYLTMINQNEKAVNSLKWLRASENVQIEYETIRRSVVEDMTRKGGWKDLIATKSDRKALLIVELVCFLKYTNGLIAVTANATQTLASSTNSFLSHSMLTIGLGFAMLVVAFCAAFMSDSVGRRPLIIISMVVTVVLHIIIATYYYLDSNTSIDVSNYYWVMYAALLAFCIVANIGIAPLMQTIQAEFFPSHTRAVGGGVTQCVAGAVIFINLKSYQMITDYFGVYLNYYIYAFCGLLGTIVIWFILPETAGRSLGQIQDDMNEEREPVTSLVERIPFQPEDKVSAVN